MDLGLAGQAVVVTGGASGIGRGIAEGFAAEGARVAIWDIASKTAEVASQVPSARGYIIAITQPASIAAALAATGEVDHLVHAAAVGSGKFGFPFTNLTPEDWPRC